MSHIFKIALLSLLAFALWPIGALSDFFAFKAPRPIRNRLLRNLLKPLINWDVRTMRIECIMLEAQHDMDLSKFINELYRLEIR